MSGFYINFLQYQKIDLLSEEDGFYGMNAQNIYYFDFKKLRLMFSNLFDLIINPDIDKFI